MKKRIWSVLTSLFLVTLVALALIFVPFDASSDFEDSQSSPLNIEQDNQASTTEVFSFNNDSFSGDSSVANSFGGGTLDSDANRDFSSEMNNYGYDSDLSLLRIDSPELV